MNLEEKQVTLRKLTASEGKFLRSKTIEYDEEGNEIERELAKEIYLGIYDSPENYEEIDDMAAEEDMQDVE